LNVEGQMLHCVQHDNGGSGFSIFDFGFEIAADGDKNPRRCRGLKEAEAAFGGVCF
jgi:hypothetical protein